MDRLLFAKSDPNAPKLAAIAELLGAAYGPIDAVPPRAGCLVLRGTDFEAMRTNLQAAPHAVLVYDIESSPALAAELGAQPSQARRFSIGRAAAEVTGALTGLDFESAAECDLFSRVDRFMTIVSAEGRPFFIRKDNLFVCGARGVVDLGQRAERGCEPARDHFAKLMPFAMFIKWALGDLCWRAAERCASIVVDDPLLRPRYGCIEFESFVAWLRADELAATFAFIPWNYKRSDPRTAALFRENPERLSICVHGCDHTKGEFAARDPARLDAMAQTALARMQKHEERYKLRHDRVMVFPQGKFSLEALAALKRAGYAAAVNSSPFPVEYDGEFTLHDLLDLAITRPDGVPLYRRRYPGDLFAFASDLFFERPAILVQHHQDFREGFGALSAFIDKLKAVEPKLRWMPLNAALDGSYWSKQNGATRRLLNAEPSGKMEFQTAYSAKDRAGIAGRRYLSEFRDRYVHPNAVLSSWLARVRG